VGGGEGAFGLTDPGGEELQVLHQFLVAVRHGGTWFLPAVGEGEPHLVGAVDLDVLDPLVLHQGLQATEAEQGGEHRFHQSKFVLG